VIRHSQGNLSAVLVLSPLSSNPRRFSNRWERPCRKSVGHHLSRTFVCSEFSRDDKFCRSTNYISCLDNQVVGFGRSRQINVNVNNTQERSSKSRLFVGFVVVVVHWMTKQTSIYTTTASNDFS